MCQSISTNVYTRSQHRCTIQIQVEHVQIWQHQSSDGETQNQMATNELELHLNVLDNIWSIWSPGLLLRSLETFKQTLCSIFPNWLCSNTSNRQSYCITNKSSALIAMFVHNFAHLLFFLLTNVQVYCVLHTVTIHIWCKSAVSTNGSSITFDPLGDDDDAVGLTMRVIGYRLWATKVVWRSHSSLRWWWGRRRRAGGGRGGRPSCHLLSQSPPLRWPRRGRRRREGGGQWVGQVVLNHLGAIVPGLLL